MVLVILNVIENAMTRSLFGKSSECDKGANASLCGPPASLLSRKPQPWAFLLGSRSYLAIWIPSYLSLAWRMPGPTCCVWPPSSSLSFSIFAIVVVLSGQCSPASPHCSPGSADRHLLHLVFIEGLTYQCSVCAEPHINASHPQVLERLILLLSSLLPLPS